MTQTAKLRVPAFGRELLELRRAGMVPNPPQVFIALDDWTWAKGRARVVVPADVTDPLELNFSFVAGIDAWLGWRERLTPIFRRDAVIRAILRANPARLIMVAYELRPIGLIQRAHDVLGISRDVPKVEQPRFVWIKSKQVGIELAEFATP